MLVSLRKPGVVGGRSGRSTFEYSIGRYPGTVWSLGLWCLLFAANLAFAIAFPANGKSSSTATHAAFAWAAAVVLVLVLAGPRTPRWFLKLSVLSGVAVTLWLIHDAATPLGMVVYSLAFVVFAAYAAVWLGPRFTAGLLLAIGAGFLVILGSLGELPALLAPWFLVMTITAGLAIIVGHLTARLKHLATTDPLTGLLNRSGLELLLDLSGRPGRSSLPRSLVVIDLDGFKQINDEQGHLAGDALLVEMAHHITASIRADDIAARTGGDEFTLIIGGGPETVAQAVLDRLRARTSIRWSAGVADWPADQTFDVAFAAADGRMYEAKTRAHPRRP